MKIAVTFLALTGVLLAAGACQGTSYNSGGSTGRSGQYGSRDTEVHGTGGKGMTVDAPRKIVLVRGGQEALQVGIDRDRFRGPVTVSISNLPSGVKADDSSIRAETTEATFILKASKSADLVKNHAAMVKVEGPDGMAASQYVEITVRD